MSVMNINKMGSFSAFIESTDMGEPRVALNGNIVSTNKVYLEKRWEYDGKTNFKRY